jgi:hypothetical protein
MNRIIFIGTDGGGWYIGKDGKIHRIPGWNPEELKDVAHLLGALRDVSQIKTAGVADRLSAALHETVTKQLGAHIQAGDVVVLG